MARVGIVKADDDRTVNFGGLGADVLDGWPPDGLPSKAAIIAAAGLSNPDILVPSGNMSVTTDGAVIENYDVSGIISVNANNVTIRNCRVRGYSNVNVIRLQSGRHHLTIENCEVEALPDPNDAANGPVGAIGGNGGTHMTVRNTYVHGFADGIKIESGTAEDRSLYERNYIRMSKPSGAAKHLDGMQASGDSYFTIRENVIDADIAAGGNAAIFIQAYNGAACTHAYSPLVERNYVFGGNYCIYLMGGKESKCANPESYGHNYICRDNVFTPDPDGTLNSGSGYRYGYIRKGVTDIIVTNNRFEDGTLVPGNTV